MKSFHRAVTLLLIMSACRSPGDTASTGPEPVPEKRAAAVPQIQVQFVPASEEVRKSEPVQPAAEAKTGTPVALIREEDGTRPPTFADVVRLQKAVVANNRVSDVERERLAVLHVMANELIAAEDVMDTLKTVSDPFLDMVAFYLSDHLGEHQEAEQRLNKFLDQWRRQKGLTIGRSLLCDKVQGYRRYVPSSSSTLPPGTPALVYIELHNFTLAPNQDRQVMHLRFAWELLDEKGSPVVVEFLQKVKPEEREVYVEFNDTVTDCHQNFNFPLPQNLPMGKYSIKITAEDVPTGKKASTAVEFHVQAR